MSNDEGRGDAGLLTIGGQALQQVKGRTAGHPGQI
jgi:hypothetical protein